MVLTPIWSSRYAAFLGAWAFTNSCGARSPNDECGRFTQPQSQFVLPVSDQAVALGEAWEPEGAGGPPFADAFARVDLLTGDEFRGGTR